jgi:hypothetical protein
MLIGVLIETISLPEFVCKLKAAFYHGRREVVEQPARKRSVNTLEWGGLAPLDLWEQSPIKAAPDRSLQVLRVSQGKGTATECRPYQLGKSIRRCYDAAGISPKFPAIRFSGSLLHKPACLRNPKRLARVIAQA